MNINKHINICAAKLGVEKDIKKMSNVYLPMYENMKDPVHGVEHIKHVVSDALDIMLWLSDNGSPLGYDDIHMVLLACFCHDLFTLQDRENHHILGQKYFSDTQSDPLVAKLRTFDMITVGTAIYEHRASNQPYRFSSLVSEILASADRGAPVLANIVKRIVGDRKLTIHMVNHISEKYGTSGYVQYPNLYIEYYGRNKIDLFHKDVDSWVAACHKDMEKQDAGICSSSPDCKMEDTLRDSVVYDNNSIGSHPRIDADVCIGICNFVGDYVDIGNRVLLGNHNIIGGNVQIGADASIMSYIIIRDDVVISSSVEIGHKSELGSEAVVGTDTNIGNNTRVSDRVVIRDSCCVGNNVIIMPDVYVHDNVTIKNNAVIGKGVRILEGLTVCGVILPYTVITKSTTTDS